MDSFMGRGNLYIQLVKVLYCKLLTNGKQLLAFSLEVRPGTETQSQKWEVRVLPLCHHGPKLFTIKRHLRNLGNQEILRNISQVS